MSDANGFEFLAVEAEQLENQNTVTPPGADPVVDHCNTGGEAVAGPLFAGSFAVAVCRSGDRIGGFHGLQCAPGQRGIRGYQRADAGGRRARATALLAKPAWETGSYEEACRPPGRVIPAAGKELSMKTCPDGKRRRL